MRTSAALRDLAIMPMVEHAPWSTMRPPIAAVGASARRQVER
jgi:hypothetical protein